MQQLEKKSRLDCDTKSNERIVRHMVKLAFDAKQWDLLNETVKALSKKRALIKMNMTYMVWIFWKNYSLVLNLWVCKGNFIFKPIFCLSDDTSFWAF